MILIIRFILSYVVQQTNKIVRFPSITDTGHVNCNYHVTFTDSKMLRRVQCASECV